MGRPTGLAESLDNSSPAASESSDKKYGWSYWLWLDARCNEWMYYAARDALTLEFDFAKYLSKQLDSRTEIKIKGGEKFLVDFGEMSARSVSRRGSTRVKREVTGNFR